MNSEKRRLIVLLLKSSILLGGWEAIRVGGFVSRRPPVGALWLAHEDMRRMKDRVVATAPFHSSRDTVSLEVFDLLKN